MKKPKQFLSRVVLVKAGHITKAVQLLVDRQADLVLLLEKHALRPGAFKLALLCSEEKLAKKIGCAMGWKPATTLPWLFVFSPAKFPKEQVMLPALKIVFPYLELQPAA